MNRRLVVPLSRIGNVVAAVTAAVVLSACSHPGHLASGTPPSNLPSASATPSASPAAAMPPTIVGVTTAGALVTLNPTTGVIQQTLVPSGVAPGTVSVSASGLIYFAAANHGCNSKIEAIPIAGGTAAFIAPGYEAAISPDGSKLAYATVPDCVPNTADETVLDIRTLSSGATVSLPDLPPGQDGGLPHPISQLSWSADNDHVAVSVLPSQDYEGFEVNLVDTAQAQYYLAGAGVLTVPVTGSPDPQGTVLGAGVYMPNGDLFVNRFCCEGIPVRNISSLMWEVSPSGAFVHQVAIGYLNVSHSSLDVSSDGQWLLYLAGNDAYVSQGGATPRKLTTGLRDAAWS